MRRARFVIVGSGWRSLYYVRIAKALPERFELCAMLCRTREKADKMALGSGIYATTSEAECVSMKPDFVVVAVNKSSLAEVSSIWLMRGFTVLCETPAAADLDSLHRLWALHQAGAKLVIAEQYTRYPRYQAMLKALKDGRIGRRDCINISLAHEYHGASLMRAFLDLDASTPFCVRARTYRFPTTETLTRYERFTDGRVAEKARTAATFEFSDGRVAFYDFDSEQYRSPIRRNHIKVQGTRGELLDDTLCWLDGQNNPVEQHFETQIRMQATDDPNPNLAQIREVTSIRLGEEMLYTPPFGLCGLTEDETAIAQLMTATAAYARGEQSEPDSLSHALQDAYMTLLLQAAIRTGSQQSSEPQPWN